MNNETVASISSQAIDDIYIAIVESYTLFSSFAILIYVSILQFPDELEYIWKSKFTLPTFLYVSSKYPLFFYIPLMIFQYFVSSAGLESLRLCNDQGIVAQVISIFPFIGVQGLISLRGYALCQGYRPMTMALSITFLAALAFQIYGSAIPTCSITPENDFLVDNLIHNLAIILSDMLAFIAVIHQVWGLWKLRRNLGLQNNKDLATSLIRQGILRFCFVLFITTTSLFLALSSVAIGNYFNSFQNIFSSLLICEFTLDLRRRNARNTALNQSAVDLPTLSFQDNLARSVLSRLHMSIMSEMGERNGPDTDIPSTISTGSREYDLNLQDGSHLDHSENQAEISLM